MSKGALEGAKLFYAQAVMSRRVVFDDLCDEIAETCTLTSADIKAVLDRVIWAGRIQSGRLQRRHDPQAQGRVFTRQTPARHAQPSQVQPLHRRQG